MPDKVSSEGRMVETLVCKITLGPLVIDTEASLEQVAALILALVKEYRELPRAER